MNHSYVEPTPAELAAEPITPMLLLNYTFTGAAKPVPGQLFYDALKIYSDAIAQGHSAVSVVAEADDQKQRRLIELLRRLGVLTKQTIVTHPLTWPGKSHLVVPFSKDWIPNDYDKTIDRLVSRLDAKLTELYESDRTKQKR